MTDCIHVFMGTDEGMVAEQATKLFHQLKPANADDFSNEIIHGNAENAEHAFTICKEVIQSLQTLSMFSEGKVVWLKGANFFASDRTSESELAKEGAFALQEALEQGLPKGVVFLLSSTGIDKRRSLFKFLKEYGKVKIFDAVDASKANGQQALTQNIAAQAKKLNLQFDRKALDLFSRLVNENTRQINSELEKINTYLGEKRRKVEEEDVEIMISLSKAGIVFEIGRALQQGKIKRTLQLIDRQLEQGDSAIAILRASIIPTVRNLFLVKTLMESFKTPINDYKEFHASLSKYPSQDLAWLPSKKSGEINYYPLFLSAKDARRFDLKTLKKALEKTHEADIALVTTSLNPRVLLHKLILEISQ